MRSTPRTSRRPSSSRDPDHTSSSRRTTPSLSICSPATSRPGERSSTQPSEPSRIDRFTKAPPRSPEGRELARRSSLYTAPDSWLSVSSRRAAALVGSSSPHTQTVWPPTSTTRSGRSARPTSIVVCRSLPLMRSLAGRCRRPSRRSSPCHPRNCARWPTRRRQWRVLTSLTSTAGS